MVPLDTTMHIITIGQWTTAKKTREEARMSGGFRMSLGGGVAGTPQASLSVFGDGDSDEDKEETPQRSGGVRFKTQSRSLSSMVSWRVAGQLCVLSSSSP